MKAPGGHLRQVFTYLLLSATLLVACGTRSKGGSDTDDTDSESVTATDTQTATDIDTETETDSGNPVGLIPTGCPSSLVETCDETAWEAPPRLYASDLGEGVRFVDVAFGTEYNYWTTEQLGGILAQQDDGVTSQPVLYVLDFDFFSKQTTNTVQSDATPGLEAVALAGYDNSETHPRYMAILCTPDSCAMFQSDADLEIADDLAPITGGELPIGLEPNGLTRQEYPSHASWVFGNGIWHFDGETWTEELAIAEEISINALLAEGLAVGDNGRLWERIDLGGEQWWEESESGTSADLLDIMYDEWDSYLLIAAEDGSLGTLISAAGEYEPLSSDPLSTITRRKTGWSILAAADASGCVYEDIDTSPCVKRVMPETPIGVFSWQCGGSSNLGLFGENGLWGWHKCIDIR